MKINKIQELNLDLIYNTKFNCFDGEVIYRDLVSHTNLWDGVILDRAGYNSPHAQDFTDAIDLIKLRDIKSGNWNVDTLYIRPKKGKEVALKKLAKEWSADEIDWIGGEDAASKLGASFMNGPKEILRVWFD